MIRRQRNFMEWLKSRLAIQIFSLLVALIAWAFVNSGQTIQQRKTIRIQYVQLPSNLVFERNPIKEVKVDLTGSLFRIRSLSEENLTYPVDLSRAKSGATHIELDIDNLRLPLDIEAAHVNPRAFNVYLEEMFTRTLPIKPVFIGKPREGFQVGTVKVSPESIAVNGPKSLLTKISEIEVEVPLENRELTFSEVIKPKVNLPGTDTMDSVTVEVEISAQKLRQEFPSVLVTSGQNSRKVKLTPHRGKVILEGPQSDIRALESKIEIVVPVEGLKRGRFRIRGKVNLPDKIKLISIEPESFLVEVLQEGARQ